MIIFSGNIQPNYLMAALKDLCNTSLYKNEGIVINSEWQEHFNQSKQNQSDCVVDIESTDSIDFGNDSNSMFETLVHGYSKTRLIDDLETKIIQIPPYEGFRPLNIF